jgi:deoxyadenosine/deoxycytidine kinase
MAYVKVSEAFPHSIGALEKLNNLCVVKDGEVATSMYGWTGQHRHRYHMHEQSVPYKEAAKRHLEKNGDDDETGQPHIIHAAWNLLAAYQLQQQEPIICSIEGNIGAGKTTFAQYLLKNLRCEDPSVHLVEEPVTSEMVQQFYNSDDKKMAAAAFREQLLVNYTLSYYGRLPFQFSDRCPFSTTMFDKVNGIKSVDLSNDFVKPTFYVYVRTPVAECKKRILERNRLGEETVSAEYLEKLEQVHDETLMQMDYNEGKVIIVDGMESFEEQAKNVIVEILHYWSFYCGKTPHWPECFTRRPSEGREMFQ